MPTGRLVRQDGRTRPHDEITADYTDMISAATPQEIVAQGLRPEVAAASSGRRRRREEAASLPGSIPSNAGDRAANSHRFPDGAISGLL